MNPVLDLEQSLHPVSNTNVLPLINNPAASSAISRVNSLHLAASNHAILRHQPWRLPGYEAFTTCIRPSFRPHLLVTTAGDISVTYGVMYQQSMATESTATPTTTSSLPSAMYLPQGQHPTTTTIIQSIPHTIMSSRVGQEDRLMGHSAVDAAVIPPRTTVSGMLQCGTSTCSLPYNSPPSHIRTPPLSSHLATQRVCSAL